MKWAIFRPRSSTPGVRSFCLCPFHWKLRTSVVSLEPRELENIPQIPGIWAEVGENHDAQKAVSATLSVLKWGGAIFRLRSSKLRVQKVLVCPFHRKPRPSGVRLESLGLENIPQVPANRAKVAENHDARKALSATLLVLKWSGTIFRPRSWKPSVRSLSRGPSLCKPRQWRVSLDSRGLKNIPQVPGNPAKVAQTHDARKAVSATLRVLKWSGAIFRPRSLTPSVRSFYLCPFH